MGRQFKIMLQNYDVIVNQRISETYNSFGWKTRKIAKSGPLRTHSIFADSEEILKSHLLQFNKNILIKKDKKLQRDKKAFKDGKAYKWQSNQTNGRHPF